GDAAHRRGQVAQVVEQSPVEMLGFENVIEGGGWGRHAGKIMYSEGGIQNYGHLYTWVYRGFGGRTSGIAVKPTDAGFPPAGRDSGENLRGGVGREAGTPLSHPRRGKPGVRLLDQPRPRFSCPPLPCISKGGISPEPGGHHAVEEG